MATPPPTETCDGCVFDAARWTRQDAIRTLDNAAGLVGFATEGLSAERWNLRPADDTWSIGEYVNHIREVIELNRIGCELGLAEPGMAAPEIGEPAFAAAAATHDPAVLFDQLETQGQRAAEFFGSIEGEEWDRGMIVQGDLWPPAYAITHICHDLFHHLADIAAIRVRLGDIIGPLEGTVAQINASDGGVPKSTVTGATIGPGGLDGDRQATRRHHGRPWQAVSLWSADVIDELAAAGHPVTPGAAGENLTLRGIDWARLRAGLVLSVGDVGLRLSSPAAPCTKISGCFSDRDHTRIAHDRPGTARWYASVMQGGDIAVGDPVTIGS